MIESIFEIREISNGAISQYNTQFLLNFFFKEKQVHFITIQILEVGSYGKMKFPFDFFS